MSRQKEKVKIHDVAKAAGVSIATVSRALNNKDNVKESTYKKIMQATRDVGYDNFTMRNDSNLILILLPDINNPFYSDVVKGIAVSANNHNYQEIIVRTGNHPLTQSFVENIMHDTNAAGIITLDPVSSVETLNNLRKKIPIVQCAEHIEHPTAPYVSIDDISAGKAVVEYIVSKGRRKIALITGPLMYKYSRKRKEGFLEALKLAGIEPVQNYILSLPEFSYDTAFSAATQLLSMDDRPNAIFAVSDVFAVAAVKAARKLGLSVPKDVGIIGFDNTETSIMCEPPLTTVKQPQFQLGYLACEMLLEQIADNKTTPKQLLLDVELVIRESM